MAFTSEAIAKIRVSAEGQDGLGSFLNKTKPVLAQGVKLMFAKLLIANRGEIACRIIKTARRMGIATVALYSDADQDALHVHLADEAVHIGPAPSKDSYLQAQRIIDVAKKVGADIIHPGYGFLSENAEFARLCEDNQLVFVGPPIAAIDAMGFKICRQADHARC